MHKLKVTSFPIIASFSHFFTFCRLSNERRSRPEKKACLHPRLRRPYRCRLSCLPRSHLSLLPLQREARFRSLLFQPQDTCSIQCRHSTVELEAAADHTVSSNFFTACPPIFSFANPARRSVPGQGGHCFSDPQKVVHTYSRGLSRPLILHRSSSFTEASQLPADKAQPGGTESAAQDGYFLDDLMTVCTVFSLPSPPISLPSVPF